MHRRTSPKTFSNSHVLRLNQTEAEEKLWQVLRAHRFNDFHFRRQHAIGAFIVDFCAPQEKIIIEVDGGQHLSQEEYDIQRTEFLKSKGYRVLRFWNHQVLKDIEGVVQVILNAVKVEKS